MDFTAEAEKAAHENAQDKADAVELTPAVTPAPKEVDLSLPDEYSGGIPSGEGYEKYASNDGTFVINKLDDETNVEAGNVMEAQARSPAHQQHELTVEDIVGLEQAAALMTPRGNPHYDNGGSIAEVDAGASFGET